MHAHLAQQRRKRNARAPTSAQRVQAIGFRRKRRLLAAEESAVLRLARHYNLAEKMPTGSAHLNFTLAGLVAAGGVFGYVKARSMPSVSAGQRWSLREPCARPLDRDPLADATPPALRVVPMFIRS